MENQEIIKNSIAQLSSLLKSASNEKRLSILFELEKGERSVGEMERLFELSQSSLSQHLAVLRREGYVCARRDAQRVNYSLRGKEIYILLKTLRDLCDVDASVQQLLN